MKTTTHSQSKMVKHLSNSKTILSAPGKFDPKTRTITIAGRVIKIGGALPPLKNGEKLIRYTQSICPYCYRLLPAVITERENKIFIRKLCPDHGEIEEVYFEDSEIYKRFEKYTEIAPIGRGVKPYVKLEAPCPFNCGLCPLHQSHTALLNVVVTNRCDLDCWYCFFYAEKVGFVYEPTLDQIEFMMKRYLEQKVVPAVQLTGGEPTIREDLVEIVKLLKKLGIRHIQLNTHGIKFAQLWWNYGADKAIEYAHELRSSGVNTVYLSFDGVTPQTNPKNHWEIPFIFEAFRKAKMTSVVLVPTIIRSVNDHELGDIIRFAANNMDIVRSVNFQPVSLTGMMKRFERLKYRITIADAIKKIEEQTNGQISRESWFPVPAATYISSFIEALSKEFKLEFSNHPHCGAGTYVYVIKKGDDVAFIPIDKMIDIDGFLEYLKTKGEEIRGKGRLTLGIAGIQTVLSILTRFIIWENVPTDLKKKLPSLLLNIFIKRSYEALGEFHYRFLFLGMMHFMDLYNYDVERVLRCNIHYALPDGRIVPFCTFNVLSDLYRDYVQKHYFLTFEEYESKYGKGKLGEESKFRRSKEYIDRVKNHELYKRTYEKFSAKL